MSRCSHDLLEHKLGSSIEVFKNKSPLLIPMIASLYYLELTNLSSAVM